MNAHNENLADKRRILIFTVLALALAAVASALRLLCLFFFYDKIGYYQRGEILPIISNIFYAASIVFFAIAARFVIKPQKQVAPLSKPSRVASLLPLCATVFYLINYFLVGVDSPKWYDYALLVCGVISAIFFASLAFCSQPSNITALTGVGAIVWFASAAMKSYLDFFVPMNSPDKLFFQLGALGATLIVFCEIRALYGIGQPRAYLFGFFAGILAICTSAIPSLIASANDIFASYTLANEDIVMLTLAIYAAVRLLTTAPAKAQEQSEAADSTAE